MKKLLWFTLILLTACGTEQQLKPLRQPEKPWVFWYWMKGYVSKEGITADLEAMAESGIAGAYLMPIQGPDSLPVFTPTAVQLTPEWWQMVRHAFTESKRLGLELGVHASDGFALAGGPWITPALSMQKVTWSETIITGDGSAIKQSLSQPPTKENYYKDIAVFALKTKIKAVSSFEQTPLVTSSTGEQADFLVINQEDEQFRCKDDCWFQYEFTEPFTCQSLKIYTKGNNYQAHRLQVYAGDDTTNLELIAALTPPRHGWQDVDEQVTYSIPQTTARFFRFTWSKDGSEPGAEDLDAAKWSPRLKIAALELMSQPRIHQYEGKNGSIWRISPRTTRNQLPDQNSYETVLNITEHMDTTGVLAWEVPEGEWIILRMGHTSTGHTNATAGGGLGLECDKFNPVAVNAQFDGWFGQFLSQLGPELTSEVLKIFHVDSWECGSQNWSPVFAESFEELRGYDPIEFLPVMAGYPIKSARISEQYLFDVRRTISELTTTNFYETLRNRAHQSGIQMSAESIAPTMMSDGMRHYELVDLPMGEFWLNSPTHDKPNDLLDAISGAHIYGKQIIQAEGFTTLRMDWTEHPEMLKPVLDRNYALGINKLVFHVFAHNPWLDRAPGMTLDGVGLYFQRDQTWWKSGKAFVDYTTNCQKWLQQGTPVVDIAVFTGSDMPRRAILPDRLVTTLPGLFGDEVVKNEKIRLKNEGQPQRELPKGVRHSANMADPEDWTNPLNGYKYDSFNEDALLRLAKVKDGKIVLSTGASYAMLILPKASQMTPNSGYLTEAVIQKLHALITAGATVMISDKPTDEPGMSSTSAKITGLIQEIWEGNFETVDDIPQKSLGKGKVLKAPFLPADFQSMGLSPDLSATENGLKAEGLAWNHRQTKTADIYFISNQFPEKRELHFSLRASDRLPEIYNPVTNEQYEPDNWYFNDDHTDLLLELDSYQSLFIIQERPTDKRGRELETFAKEKYELNGVWRVQFDSKWGGPKETQTLDKLQSWTESSNPAIQYYSGTATYELEFEYLKNDTLQWLMFDQIGQIAEVTLNGKYCGTIWTPPYQVNVTNALQNGQNKLIVRVTNTWHNRLMGDQLLPIDERITWTVAPYRLAEDPLQSAGIMGSVWISE